MGCNAHNHGPNCNCGWGGDTGGGWSTSTAPATGMFTRDRPIVHMSCTIPNATCPVCGASVYFYESPYGGRVFFDELGPPWPKHPCTDNAPIRAMGGPRIEVDQSASQPIQPPQWSRDGWHPLESPSVSQIGAYVTIDAEDGRKQSFWIPDGFRYSQGDPILARRSPNGNGSWEISYLPINSNLLNVRPESVLAYPRIPGGDTAKIWQRALLGDAEAHNQIGMALSFMRGVKAEDGTWTFSENIDWAAAELHFLLAAAGGCWAGFHNLGIMFRHGLGGHHDPALSMQYLLLATGCVPADICAPSRSALAELLDLGWGTEGDRVDAQAFLDARPNVECESDPE